MPKSEIDRLCKACGRELGIGDDAVAVQRCVIGPRGPVPIDAAELFCDDECLHGESGDTVRRSRRIP